MPTAKGGGTRGTTVFAVLTAVGVAAMLAASDTAIAGPDPLSSSSTVTLQLRSSGGLKLKPATLALPVNTGQLDPITGAGSVQTNAPFRARRGGRKTKVKITQLILGANGGPGRIDAKVGKRKVNGFGKLRGGTLNRDGWGAKLDGVIATLGSKGAKALNRALSGQGRGKASAASRRVKAGLQLGSLSVRSVPKTVEVLPGGSLVMDVPISGCGGICFPVKLAGHCVNPLAPGGVAPIPPAVQSGVVGEIFTFPVTGGSVAPDFSSGNAVSAGGQVLTKNNDGSVPPLGCSSPPSVGTSISQSGFQTQFDLKALSADVVLPPGPVGFAALGTFDLTAPGASASADVNTKQLTITAAPVRLAQLSADILNNTFPNQTGNPQVDFVSGDLLARISLTVTTH